VHSQDGVKDISARRLKASTALKIENQAYGQKVAEMARMPSSRMASYSSWPPASPWAAAPPGTLPPRSRPVQLQQLDLLPVLLAAQYQPYGRLLSRPALVPVQPAQMELHPCHLDVELALVEGPPPLH
jgi:hypothetical protein